jgi:hypothetical protein
MELYDATRASSMVYSGTEGVPQKMGDINSTVQSARLPREVITGNTGLCIELSLMYASVIKAAGLHPIIFLIPGHAFPGVLINNYYFAIEATGVGGKGLGSIMSKEDAFNTGAQELQKFMQGIQQGDTRNIIIDVNDLETKGVVPMELGDDDFLRKKVDDIAATFSRGGGSSSSSSNNNNNNRETTRRPSARRSSSGSNSNVAGYSGVISFNYPAAWVRRDYPSQQVSTLVTNIVADQGSGISVWNASASNPDQALYIMRNQLATVGLYITYQKTGVNNGWTLYRGSTNHGGVINQWEGAFRSGGNGIVGITLGSPNFASYQAIFNNILSTVR